jgi:hypothetical protein
MIWTRDLLTLLNHAQRVGCYEPYRCPHDDGEHERYAVQHDLRAGLLEATTDGWICPV